MGIPLHVVSHPVPPGEKSRLLRLGRVFGVGVETGYLLDPGSMWHEPKLDEDGRECWAVVLPNGRVWRTTDPSSDPPHELWDITGEPPAITVHPSIHDISSDGGWHGWIRGRIMEPA